MDKLAITIAGEITLSKDPGSSMKKWREIFGVSQVDLAKYLNVSSSTISDYESGRRKSPGIGVINRFINALIEIDKANGSKILTQLQRDFGPETNAFEVHEFNAALMAEVFAKKIEAVCLANESKLKKIKIYGYTLIDSLKFILDTPINEYMKIYGLSPERALIFQKVESGRSPMIAVKLSRFSTQMKPAIVVLHSQKKPTEIDPLAIKLAENERIPLLLTAKPANEIVFALNEFEQK